MKIKENLNVFLGKDFPIINSYYSHFHCMLAVLHMVGEPSILHAVGST